MLNVISQGGSNRKAPEVTSCYVPSPDDIAIQIRRVRESAPPLFSATVDSIFVEGWTRVMSQSFKALSIPKSLKKKKKRRRIMYVLEGRKPLCGLNV